MGSCSVIVKYILFLGALVLAVGLAGVLANGLDYDSADRAREVIHPLCMGLALYLFIAWGCILAKWGGQCMLIVHVVLTIVSLGLMGYGFYSVYASIEATGQSHVANVHAWIGIACMSCMLVPLIFGACIWPKKGKWRKSGCAHQIHTMFAEMGFMLGFTNILYKFYFQHTDANYANAYGLVGTIVFIVLTILLVIYIVVGAAPNTSMSRVDDGRKGGMGRAQR